MGTVAFTDKQAEGAIPNGTRVMKLTKEEGDAHDVGAKATVLGSMGPIHFMGRLRYGYFVEWDDLPGLPVFVGCDKIGRVP